MIIDGKALSEEILLNLKEERKKYNDLKIAAFLIGKEEEKLSFLKIKQKFAQELDIEFRIYEIDDNLSKKKIRKYISQIIRHKTIQGGIFQLPIPDEFPTQYLLNTILPQKDIDCLSSKLLGKFFTNSSIIRPPAVEVVDFLKNKFNLDFQGKIALVVGYGRLVGKPIAHYLAHQKATVIIAQSQSNLNEYLETADIVVSGVGKVNLINYCKQKAVLIDFGYSKENGKISGDINFEKLKNEASLITPTPNGTGPILVAKLFENFFKLLKNDKVI
jgi:methylenetetrahydrofolate dehydrogenase (NADP+)/methenyltetrahydrofolate cyclohydrolase